MASGSGTADSGEIDVGLRGEIQAEKYDDDESGNQAGGAEHNTADPRERIAEAVLELRVVQPLGELPATPTVYFDALDQLLRSLGKVSLELGKLFDDVGAADPQSQKANAKATTMIRANANPRFRFSSALIQSTMAVRKTATTIPAKSSKSLIGMGAACFGLISPIQGAIAQEVIDLLSILNSLRMILPTGSLSDFQIPAAVINATKP
jgi:hypothetical protein